MTFGPEHRRCWRGPHGVHRGNAKPDTEEHPPQVDLQRVLVSLDEERCKLERVIAELRIVDIDDVPEEHDSGEVVWTSEDAGNVASDTLAREVGIPD